MRKLRRLAGGRLLPCVLLALFFALVVAALSLWLPRLLAPVALAGAALSLVAALIVAASDEPAEYKISKLVLILLLPWTGAGLCLLWRAPSRGQNPTPSPAQGGGTNRAFSLAQRCGLTPAEAESATYFPVGKDMAQALLSDLKRAKRYAFLQYYIVERGVFFSEVLQALTACVRRGVEVRLLYDDFGSSLTLPRDFARSMERLGIGTAAVKRLKWPTRAAGRRDHRKIAVIDGEIAYTGGINLADEYIGARVRFGHWKDTAVRVTGAPALRFAQLFARTWKRERPSSPLPYFPQNSQNKQNAVGLDPIPCAVFGDETDASERIGAQVIGELVSSANSQNKQNAVGFDPIPCAVFGDEAEAGERVGAQVIGEIVPSANSQNGQNAVGFSPIPCAVFGDEAEAGERVGAQVIGEIVSSAERTLYLNTPYLAPDAPLLAALKRAAAGGVDVRLMIPRVPDKRTLYPITLSYARELMASGVKVKTYTAGFLHAKSAVADGKYALVSSYNLDFRSLYLQAECGVLLESADVSAAMERDFLAAWKDGGEPKEGNPFARALGKLLRLFAPLI